MLAISFKPIEILNPSYAEIVTLSGKKVRRSRRYKTDFEVSFAKFLMRVANVYFLSLQSLVLLSLHADV